MLAGMPQEMVYAREARLVKEQRARLGMQLMLPAHPQGEGAQPRTGPARRDPPRRALAGAACGRCHPHQMLVVVLSKDSTNQYAAWNRLGGFVPSSAEREDTPSPGAPALLPAGPAARAGQAVPVAPPADLGDQSAT